MKRIDLIRHIEASGCVFLREGRRHTVYVNPISRKVSTVPRHREINDFMAKKICRELEIQEPSR
jgi:mRNA interferase HicA